VFRSKRMNRVKLLWWDGTGICLLTKRLENGQFRWPVITDGIMQLTSAQLATLLEGLEWSHTRPREVVRPSATQ
jgi:transposase